MTRITATALVCALTTMPGLSTPGLSSDMPTIAADPVLSNDNRVAAGTLNGRVLTLRLEARAGDLHPDAETDPGIPVYAFGEPGRPLLVPGPLLRVREGTAVHVSLRNRLPLPLTVHGLYARTSAAGNDTVIVAPGEVREVEFEAGAPGTYYYWGTTTATSLIRAREESQLYGAFVVDPRDAALPRDRIFVLGFWVDSIRIPEVSDTTRAFRRFVINGKSWPATERLTYELGDTVRWRVINATALTHPMHLHGAYFRVLSRGVERADTVYAPEAPPDLAITERMSRGMTMSIEWLASRPGHWLFHCHDDLHIAPNGPLVGTAIATLAAPGHMRAAPEHMGGLVLGVEVRARGPLAPAPEPKRRLRLVVRPAAGALPAAPAYQFVIYDVDAGTVAGGATVPGPPLVLRRDEPVRITVVNELPEPTAVHWHGIELDSYFDGVPGFSGHAGLIAPSIAPGDSFDARFAPPHAGTFIYHTHFDEMRQERAGLAGPLIVLGPEENYDPETDISILLGTPQAQADERSIAVNGKSALEPLELRAGRHYRLRFINMHTYRAVVLAELMRGSQPLSWRPLAKDGAPLAGERATVRPARVLLGAGETYDFDFASSEPGALRLDLSRRLPDRLLNSLPILVR